MVVKMWNAFEMLVFDVYSLTNEASRLAGGREEVVGYGIVEILGDRSKTKEIMENVKEFYDCRCGRGVAHGVDGRVDFSNRNTHDLIIKAEDYLRNSINKLIDRLIDTKGIQLGV
jgi:hypothetical protein